MRLATSQIETIHARVLELMRAHGLRVDGARRGGDVDLWGRDEKEHLGKTMRAITIGEDG